MRKIIFRQSSAIMLLIVLFAYFMLCFGVAPAYAEVEDWSETDNVATETWEDYTKNKIVPAIILALSTIATIILVISPALAKVVSAAKSFMSASSDVKSTSASSKTIQTTVSVGLKELKKAFAEADEAKTKQINELEGIIEKQNNAIYAILKIVTIAFSNSSELANSGYASQIARIAGEIEGRADGDEGGE